MNYRPEIDGLRAIAVLIVVFYHANIKYFSGGFIGVDIFFVISGFLITKIIISDIEADKFSVTVFYERRIRRIFPVLFTVILVSIPIAWFLLSPQDLKDFSQALVAIPLFVSNILFWKTSNYFAGDASLNPLLHTWSLAVEEQFYFIFPLVLLVFWRKHTKALISIVLFVFFISLLLADIYSIQKPTSAFYLIQFRAWELILGAIIAIISLKTKQGLRKGKYSEIMGALGLSLILFSILYIDSSFPFPSIYTLIPTLGAGLIILYSTKDTLVGKLLSIKPLVFIGLLSYSIYLWHQPVLAFSHHYFLGELGQALKISLLLLILTMSYFTWKYIETPFRNKNKITRRHLFSYSFILSFLLISIGIIGHINKGFEGRLNDSQQEIYQYQNYDTQKMYLKEKCFLDLNSENLSFADECISKNNSVLIWGDSFAAALSSGFRANAIRVNQATSSSCPPILDLGVENNCSTMNKKTLSLVNKIKPNILILHANWYYYKPEEISDTIQSIHEISPKIRIIVVGGVPTWQPSLPTKAVRSNLDLKQQYLLKSDDMMLIKNADIALKKLSMALPFEYISALQYLCKRDECYATLKFQNEYHLSAWDHGHLTEAGAHFLVQNLIDELNLETYK